MKQIYKINQITVMKLQFPGLGEKGLEYFRMLTDQYEKAYVAWFHGFGPFMNIVHPESAKAVLRTVSKPVQDGGAYHTFFPWIGE